MTSPAAALEFFVTEASGYIDGLDTLFASAGPAGPDREAFVRLARALRGNSTMYRQPGISRVASALERVARALRDGAIGWSPRLHGALVAVVDDLRILLRNVRAWGPADDQRAQARAAELEMMAPAAANGLTPSAPDAGREFLAAKAREVAAAAERVAGAPGDRGAISALLRSVRGLNGIAALKEHPALPEVGGSTERIAQSAELSGTAPDAAEVALLRAAAAVLLRAAGDIAGGRRVDSATPELREYARVAGEVSAHEGAREPERVVPIATLFFADGGPHVVSTATEPPTTRAARFRIEAVSHAEHLRRLIADGRDALDAPSRDRATRELRRELDALLALAESFDEQEVAAFLRERRSDAASLDRGALDTLDAVLALLADPAIPRGALERALRRRAAGEEATAAAAEPPPAPRPAMHTPTGRELREFLKTPITEIRRLEERPLTAPLPLPQEHVVPIEELLYRGRGALARARELREAIRREGVAPTRETLDELFDLLDLAAAD
ncbi:MAG TPA: hypothetical protein VFS05_00040 [Gemmatimonadaceae bacterium]|nr:hypothetical protein [Gemmatimonadaceae bacterium]